MILMIWCIYLICYKLGKIGYEVSNLDPIHTIEITQNNIKWDKIEDLDIFRNKLFQNKKIIVPMSRGSYEFEIANKLEKKIKYSLYFEEINELGINMKYKLKLDNIYVIGNENTWVDIENLQLKEVIESSNSTNIYTLEWYWEEDGNDTEIGEKVYAEYKCKINIVSEI